MVFDSFLSLSRSVHVFNSFFPMSHCIHLFDSFISLFAHDLEFLMSQCVHVQIFLHGGLLKVIVLCLTASYHCLIENVFDNFFIIISLCTCI